MFNKIISFFIKGKEIESPEVYRKYKLIAGIIFITALFDLNYASLTVLIGMKEGTQMTLFTFFIHSIILFLVRTRLTIVAITNLYVFFGALSIYVCIYYSGGFNSPVMPWLASTPIVAMLMAGKPTGIFWALLNILVGLVYGILAKNGHQFPVNYDTSYTNLFYSNTITGLILIIFLVALVFENGKNSAQKKLAEQSILLAEEKKKVALNNISQEIHDNVGQTLSIIKLNLHLIDIFKEQNSDIKLNDSVQLLTSAIQNLRNISHDLYTDMQEDVNLVEIIKEELDQMERTGVYKVNFSLQGKYRKLSSKEEYLLSRIVKEAMNNIIKHSQAHNIQVAVSYNPALFSLCISDNGIGMDLTPSSLMGQGIKTMHSRIRLIGGDIKVESKKNQGTSIFISLPTWSN